MLKASNILAPGFSLGLQSVHLLRAESTPEGLNDDALFHAYIFFSTKGRDPTMTGGIWLVSCKSEKILI